MSEMVERIGRVLAKNEGYAYDPWPYDGRARDALKALREPNADMLIAGRHGLDRKAMYDRDALLVWQDMIDEALK